MKLPKFAMLNTAYITSMCGNSLWTYWILVVTDVWTQSLITVWDSPLYQGAKYNFPGILTPKVSELLALNYVLANISIMMVQNKRKLRDGESVVSNLNETGQISFIQYCQDDLGEVWVCLSGLKLQVLRRKNKISSKWK